MSDENTQSSDVAVVEDDEARYYEVDQIFSGRPEAVKFTQLGDFVTGTVVEAFARQKHSYDPGGKGEPLYYDDGSPKLEAAMVLMTEDGLRTLYVSSWRMERALKEAFSEAGVRGPRRGGQVFVRFTELEVVKGGANPAKCYEAAYDVPGSPPVGALNVADDLRGKGQVQQALGPVLVSAECAGDDCAICSDPKCSHKCHRASAPPEPVKESSEAPPF